jgi:hypothetical protein
MKEIQNVLLVQMELFHIILLNLHVIIVMEDLFQMKINQIVIHVQVEHFQIQEIQNVRLVQKELIHIKIHLSVLNALQEHM